MVQPEISSESWSAPGLTEVLHSPRAPLVPCPNLITCSFPPYFIHNPANRSFPRTCLLHASAQSELTTTPPLILHMFTRDTLMRTSTSSRPPPLPIGSRRDAAGSHLLVGASFPPPNSIAVVLEIWRQTCLMWWGWKLSPPPPQKNSIKVRLQRNRLYFNGIKYLASDLGSFNLFLLLLLLNSVKVLSKFPQVLFYSAPMGHSCCYEECDRNQTTAEDLLKSCLLLIIIFCKRALRFSIALFTSRL